MFTLPFIDVQADPLDALLAALGYRLISLANSDNEVFAQLLTNKNVTLHFKSGDGVSRHYTFENGKISQKLGAPAHADLTIDFKDSLTGAKLLAKADTVALMTAIQDSNMTVEGDYKLILWFAQLGKHVAKIPDEYQPYVEKVKPFWEIAKPYAQQIGEFTKKNLQKTKNKSN